MTVIDAADWERAYQMMSDTECAITYQACTQAYRTDPTPFLTEAA